MGLGVGVSTGFNNIGTGDSVVAGVAIGGGVAVGTGVGSATAGVASDAGASVVVSGDLEHEQRSTRVRKAVRRIFILRRMPNPQFTIKPIKAGCGKTAHPV